MFQDFQMAEVILSASLPIITDPSPPFRMTINVLYKDHGVGRQKKLLAHAVRLRILACRNDLNRKRIVSLQLTADSSQLAAHSSQLIAFIFLPSFSPQQQIFHWRFE